MATRTGGTARSDEFFVLGSRDETAGCQLCVAAVIADDGSLTLRLRMPDCLAESAWQVPGHSRVCGLPTGHDAGAGGVGEATPSTRPIGGEHGDKAARATARWVRPSATVSSGTPKGWRVFATTELPEAGDNHRPASWGHRGGPECGPSRGGRHRRQWQLHQRLASTAGDLRQVSASRLRPSSETRWPASWSTPGKSASPSSSSGWTSARRRLPWRESPAGTPGCCPVSATARSRRTSSPAATVRELKYTRVNPAFSSVIGRVKFMERYGLTVHQAAALVLARRLLGCSERIPRRWVCPHWQWRTYRLHRTREEAREARVDVLGCCFETAETGACSATPAGEAETPTQSGSGCRAWSEARGVA